MKSTLQEYINVPKLLPLPDSSIEKRQIPDDVWLQNIFHFVFLYYDEIKRTNICEIKQKVSEGGEIEERLKKHLYDWIINCDDFDLIGFILTRENLSECQIQGEYDFVFYHSDWRSETNKKKYFVLEAKNLGYNTNNLSAFFKKGVQKFISGQYACDVRFGGMLGFVIGNASFSDIQTIEQLINRLIEKLEFYIKDSLLSIEKNAVFENPNTFISVVKREREQTEEEFTLYHIILDYRIN